MKYFIILSLAVLLLTILALGSGVYNMAATDKHWEITEKIITWVRESSIKVRSEDLEVPVIEESDIFATGAQHYNAMCTGCHLAPGKEPTEIARGLYPQAPVFHKRVAVTEAEDKLQLTKKYFWVIKNGIKMTAMAAWGPTHDDTTMWAIAAFLHELPGMTAEQYAALALDAKHHDYHE